MVAHKIVNDEKDLMIITNSGMLIRLPISTISQLGRVTQGVKLINLKEGQTVSTISVVDKVSESEVEETEEILSESPTSSEE
jgi:DNA gyrase subunit A